MAVLRVATYNIRKALGTDRRRDPHRILRVVSAIGADILFLQEADLRLHPRPSALPLDCIAEATGLHPVRPARCHGLGVHGNALLIAGKLTTEASGGLDLPGLEPRGAIAARVRLGDGRHLSLLGTHLGLWRRSRTQQLREIATHLGQWPHDPAILAGDLNERSTDALRRRLPDGLALIGTGPSFHSRLPLAELDRIAASSHFRVLEAGVHAKDEARIASDHLPIWVDLELPDPG